MLPDTPVLLLHCSGIPSVSIIAFTHLCTIANYFMDGLILKYYIDIYWNASLMPMVLHMSTAVSNNSDNYASSQAEAVIERYRL